MKAYTLDGFIKKRLKNTEFRKHYELELSMHSVASMVDDLKHADPHPVLRTTLSRERERVQKSRKC